MQLLADHIHMIVCSKYCVELKNIGRKPMRSCMKHKERLALALNLKDKSCRDEGLAEEVKMKYALHYSIAR